VRPDLLDVLGLEVLGVEPRGTGILDPQLRVFSTDLDVPEIDEVVGKLDEADSLLVDRDAALAGTMK
jgi:hypothetical protein